MFYISDISGVQSPYSQELFRLQREQQLEQAALLRAEDTSAERDVATLSERGARVTGTPARDTGASAAPTESMSPVSAGLAAGGAIRRGGDAGASASEHSSEADEAQTRKPRVPFQKQVRPVSGPAHIRPKLPETEASEEPSPGKVNPYQQLDEPTPTRSRALIASQIMSSPVVTLFGSDSTDQARELFKAKRFRHVPVISAENKLIGILSDRDFLAQKAESSSVELAMTKSVLSARPETEIRLIAEVMFTERIGAMPIVTDAGDLVGILTRSDILRTVVNQAPLELWV